MSEQTVSDFTLRDLFRSLDERKRPEDVARMILAVAQPAADVARRLRPVAREAEWYSSMSTDFQRSRASLVPQMRVASILCAVAAPGDEDDVDAVNRYLAHVEDQIGKTVGRSDYKHDRLNAAQRAARGIDISRRQYNKRFRLAAKMEDKLRRRAREAARRALTLASKSRLAAQLTWEQFSSDLETACFIAYYAARCNLRSVFTVNAQERPYDEACEAMMKRLRQSGSTNWFAVAHVMPDEDVARRLSEKEKGVLLGRYYEMLVGAGRFLSEVWQGSTVDRKTMIVRKGNDSSTWNLMAGAWNKLRDGWFALCYALGAAELVERQCFGKVMRLMAADVAMWHRSLGGTAHNDTDVAAVLPLPWMVLAGEEACTRDDVERACTAFGIEPLKSGWIARRAAKQVARFTPTPELVHGVVVSSPSMARAMRKAGVFSGKTVRLDGAEVDVESLIASTDADRESHWWTETAKRVRSEADATDRSQD